MIIIDRQGDFEFSRRRKTVDLAKLSANYSAGLRVLLIMWKSLSDPSCFKLLHVKPEVEKILKMTGFDMLLRG